MADPIDSCTQHSRCTIVQLYLPCGANVHAHVTHDSSGEPTPFTTQNGSFVGSAVFARLMPHSHKLHCALAYLPQTFVPSRGRDLNHSLILLYTVLWTYLTHDTPNPKRDFDPVSRFSAVHARCQRTVMQENDDGARITRCKKYPYIHGYFVASFPYFNGSRFRIRLIYRRNNESARASLCRRFTDTTRIPSGIWSRLYR